MWVLLTSAYVRNYFTYLNVYSADCRVSRIFTSHLWTKLTKCWTSASLFEKAQIALEYTIIILSNPCCARIWITGTLSKFRLREVYHRAWIAHVTDGTSLYLRWGNIEVRAGGLHIGLINFGTCENGGWIRQPWRPELTYTGRPKGLPSRRKIWILRTEGKGTLGFISMES